MKVLFRADATARTGAGHLMRCLTLADALAAEGALCAFVGRVGLVALGELVRRHGHGLTPIAYASEAPRSAGAGTAGRFEGDWREDADLTHRVAEAADADWLVVDHYGLGADWEAAAAPAGARVLAIDDLADRPHRCDLLLDQTLDRRAADYDAWLAADCPRLIGPRYALVRSEFALMRRRLADEPVLRGRRRWLGCAGGVDRDDVLGTIVTAWERLATPRPELSLVVGRDSPNVPTLRSRASGRPDLTLHVQAENMAELMALADLIIGTTGGITWERCCLSLPAVMGFVADNQRDTLGALARMETGLSIGDWRVASVEVIGAALELALDQPERLAAMGARAGALVDGLGPGRVSAAMLGASR